jgi:Fur family transcriptional regulator, zinc uptake regulator
MEKKSAPSFPAPGHDHGACVDGALWRAKAKCLEMGIKWTSLREKVFRQVVANHKPVSAYDLIESLAKDGKRLAPVSVYRILDVLQEAGLVHRLESRNAFFACMTEHDPARRSITFMCDGCECVIEVEAPDAFAAIARAASAGRFHPRSTVIEVAGVCAECASTGDLKSC